MIYDNKNCLDKSKCFIKICEFSDIRHIFNDFHYLIDQMNRHRDDHTLYNAQSFCTVHVFTYWLIFNNDNQFIKNFISNVTGLAIFILYKTIGKS